MKSQMKKFSFALAVVLVAALLGLSLIGSTNPIHDGGEEYTYQEVREFVMAEVVEKVKVADSRDLDVRSFSRCPSGYNFRLAENGTTPAEDGFIYGKVMFYNGCAGTEICQFRINMEQQVAQLSTLEEDQFLTASVWLENTELPELTAK